MEARDQATTIEGDDRLERILYVDDERQNLLIFELTFGQEFDIVTASSAAIGLSMVRQLPFAVVVSDQRMPQMDGLEFLGKVAALDPPCSRILVSAFADPEGLERAKGAGHVHAFLAKPWVDTELREVLKRQALACAQRRQVADPGT